MNDLTSYEYSVKKTVGPGAVIKRVAIGAAAVLLAAGLLYAGLLLELFPVFLAIAVGVCFVAVFLLRKYSSTEYEYEVYDGTVVFSEIFGKRSRRKVLEFELRACRSIAPVADEARRDAAIGGAVCDSYFAVSSPEAPDIFVAVFDAPGGKVKAVYFEMTESMAKICRSYNPGATVLK